METIKELRATLAGADDFEAADLAIFADCDADDPIEVQQVAQCATPVLGGYQPGQIEEVRCHGRLIGYLASRGYSEGFSMRLYATAQAAYDSLNLDDEPWVTYGVAPIPGLLLKDAIALWNREVRSVSLSTAACKAACDALAAVVLRAADPASASHARAVTWLG